MVSKLKAGAAIVLIGLTCCGIGRAAFSSLAGRDRDLGKVVYGMFPGGRDHDFGKVPRGTLCKHVFRIVNTSDLPLEVTNVRAWCRPLTAHVSKHVLQPHEEGKLVVNLDTSRFVGSKTVAFWLEIQKNNGVKEEFKFLIQADSDGKQILEQSGK